MAAPPKTAALPFTAEVGTPEDVTWPVLEVAIDWVERHCVVPDRFEAGQPYRLAEYQLWFYANHYRVKEDAELTEVPEYDAAGTYLGQRLVPTGAPAFFYRRSQIIMPQKALALETPVATPQGWTTMGDIAVGDVVFDRDGQPTEVLAKSQVFHEEAYRVRFSDHSQLVAGPDHRWLVDRRKAKGTAIGEWWTTKEMLSKGITDSAGARRFRVANAGALDLPAADLPVDPYTLGAWLGDGGAHDGRITGLDDGVFDCIESAGYAVRRDAKIAKRRTVLGLARQLREAGLLRNKRIPQAYLRAGTTQRWALLRGLMDTDGHCDERGGCEFTTVTPALRDGMCELLASLGIRYVVHPGMAKLNGRVTRPKYRVAFKARDNSPIFGLERKQRRLLPAGSGHAQYGHRRITAIEPIGMRETQCITVASKSHTFLAGREMIPTGNSGKGPLTASQICLEAVGPAMFAGWSDGTEIYRCRDHYCDCGWEYEYAEGEAMGAPWPTALIQVTAFSEEQAGNVWDALKPMIELGPLASVINIGEEFARLPGGGRIDKVTSSAKSRLGQRVTFVPQDELGLWVKENKMISVADTQRRGAAGMQGRVVETTNSFDPAEESVAQQTAVAAMKQRDLFRIHPQGDPALRFGDKRQRRLILQHVYRGCHWINLDSIEAEMAEILERDPAQAERFFGNRVVAGLGAWVDQDEWAKWSRPGTVVEEGTEVCGGFDGSESDDWTAIRLETKEGHRFTPTYGPDARPAYWDPRDWGGSIPRGEVSAAVDEIARKYRLRRMYCDPRDWETEIGDWALKHGEEVVLEWATYRIIDMHKALVQARTDLIQGRCTHDGDEVAAIHVANARKIAKPMERYIIGKPDQHRKIDICMADVLAHRAASDLRAEGWITKSAKQKTLTRVRGLARTH